MSRQEVQSLHHSAAFLIDVLDGRGMPVLLAAYARLDVLLDEELQR
jgi:hypothetical protein